MEYLITLIILFFAVFIFYKRLKSQDKCSKCAEKGNCYIGLRDCSLEEFGKDIK